ncbi:MAG: carbohydrate-binding family 9-like protein [Candidatus Omnitrophica bacterium]|nr:carbohydrate-binding family 9-like protein [Candidatus Omnitrophota bacterium]
MGKHCLMVGILVIGASFGFTANDPFLVIPSCRKTPVIDGKLTEGEWQFATALTLVETVGSRNVRLEQPVFYVCRDKENIYIAMDSLASNTNTIVASCVMRDHLSIIGDDCLEIMLAPGSGKDIEQFDFPVFYFAINALGTLWDCKFIPNSAETHNSWESGAEIANSVDGTRWICEVRIPFSSMVKTAPEDGTRWRMNLCRTYSGYHWAALNGSGGLNDARVGCDILFDSQAPALRIVNPHPLLDSRLQLKLEIANLTTSPQEVWTMLLRKKSWRSFWS